MGILDLVFPKNCLECGASGQYICINCVKEVLLQTPICPICERPSIDGFTHFKCKRPLGLDRLVSVWRYEGVIRKAILALKYKFATEVGRELTDIFLRNIIHKSLFVIPKSCVLVPIPLHWYRKNFRGFNQAEEIGKVVARKLELKFIPDLILRKKSTKPQTELDAESRSKNIHGVFSLNSNYSSKNLLIYPSLILFDDVYTTGSTLKEAAKVLKRRGAKVVWGLTIAR